VDERHAFTDPSPSLVAGEHAVGFELISRCEHQSVRKPQASGLAAELRRRAGDCRRRRLDANREVREERLDFGDRLGSSAIRCNEDLGIHQQGDQQLVVLVLGEGADRSSVERVVGIEKRLSSRLGSDSLSRRGGLRLRSCAAATNSCELFDLVRESTRR
jgi:hypothetical protein